MNKRFEIIKKKVIFKKFIFKIEQATLRHERYDGKMTPKLRRLSMERGDSVAAVIHNPQQDTVILTEQFRYPTLEKGPGWILEIPAGTVEVREKSEDTMERELLEEIGYKVKSLRPISTFYLSPGGSSERVHLFYAIARDTDKVAEGGGVLHEGEDIRTLIVKVDDALQMIKEGKIVDAKTILGLQWLQIHKLSSGT